jgi:hypothetical protein
VRFCRAVLQSSPLNARSSQPLAPSQGTPIPIGGGVLAFTILGVHYNSETSHIRRAAAPRRAPPRRRSRAGARCHSTSPLEHLADACVIRTPPPFKHSNAV